MLIAYLMIAVITGSALAGLALLGGYGFATALLVYCLSGTLALIMSAWIVAAFHSGNRKPFSDDLRDKKHGAIDQEKLQPKHP